MAKWRWWGGRGACVRATLAGAVNVVRSEAPDVPRPPLPGASEFRHRNFSFSLTIGDWFYFAGIWRPATRPGRRHIPS